MPALKASILVTVFSRHAFYHIQRQQALQIVKLAAEGRHGVLEAILGMIAL